MPEDYRTPLAGRPAPGQAAASGRWRLLAAYLAVLALTLVLLPLAVPLGRLDLRMPFSYGGDSLLHLTFTKTLVEQGWFWHNPALGAPGALELYEFPAVDTLPALILKALSVFTRDPALLDNLFYLLTYPLASLAAFAVCRQFGLSTGPAALAGLLYAFLPYHQFRAEGHLYLSAYFVVPPAVLVAWWVAGGRLLGRANRRRLLAAGAICAVLSTAGVYYPFFAGLFLGAAGLLALGRRRDWRHFLLGAGLAALVAAGMLVCLFPALRHVHAHPGVPASARFAWEAEIYGLKLVQLVLPVDGHRWHALRGLKTLYDQTTPLVNENRSASLGAVGTAGLLLLVGWLLFRPLAGSDDKSLQPSAHSLLDVLGVFNAVAILYGTIGGFGSIFALLLTPQLRALNRISVFIAFFALAAVAVCLDAALRRWRHSLPARAVGWAALGGLLLVGVLDQTRPASLATYQAVAQNYRADREFFHRTAAAVPAGGEIFELPYMSFPENGHTERLDDYSPCCGYLHTTGLHWSYGAMRGSAADQWQRSAASLPPEACARRLALGGFDGVLLERSGYADNGAAWEAGLRALLGPPAVAGTGRLFFRLADYTRALRATMTPAEWRRESDGALRRVNAAFLTGFAAPTRLTPAGEWLHGCASVGELRLVNPSSETQRVTLRMLLCGVRPEPTPLTLTGGGVHETWTITPPGQAATVTLDLPPGEGVLRFNYGNAGETSPHPRETVWYLTDFALEEPEAGPPPAAVTPPSPAAAAAPPDAL